MEVDEDSPLSKIFEKGRLRRARREKDTRSRNETTRKNDILVWDTGGGGCSCITVNAWLITHVSNHVCYLKSYQGGDKSTKCPIVNGITKATIKGRTDPVLLGINYATLIEDENENESLCQPFDVMKHGVKVDLVPKHLGGTGGMIIQGEDVEESFLAFDWEEEENLVFLDITKPTQEEIDTLEYFELTSPLPGHATQPLGNEDANYARRKKLKLSASDISLIEWRKRLGMLPEDVVKKTLQNTTQYYLNVDCEDRVEARDHYKSRFPALRLPRLNEKVATDTFFPSVKSNRGNTCSQFFAGTNSHRWDVYPLKTESDNDRALKDYTREVGCPNIILSDNAQSEIGVDWTDHLRTHCIGSEFTEPKHPWQNDAEPNIGALGRMVKHNMSTFKAPLSRHDWCQKWCCDIQNMAAHKKNGWLTPETVSTGRMTDISKCRFHFWEPIWYYEPSKTPKSSYKKARWLGFANLSGDEMTYYIEPEDPKTKGRRKPQALVRSIIKSRRKNIGKETEYINDDPIYADFFLTAEEIKKDNEYYGIDNDDQGEEVSQLEVPQPEVFQSDLNNSENINVETVDDEEVDNDADSGEPNLDETLPAGQEADKNDFDELQNLMNQLDMEEEEDHFEFVKIVDHDFTQGLLMLSAIYRTSEDEEILIKTPFATIKKDVPTEVARYIRKHVLEDKRNGYFENWAKKHLKSFNRRVRRLHRVYNIDKTVRTTNSRRARANKQSRNNRNANAGPREKYGFVIPGSVRQALLLDRENKNNDWAEAIQKEMNALELMGCFEYHSPNHNFSKAEGWQFAPLQMIFDVKSEDHRKKARLVCGGHVVDSSNVEKYSSVTDGISIKLLFLIAAQKGLSIATGDVSNAFINAPCREKIWSRCGPEFGPRIGMKLRVLKALYGLSSSSRAFHEFLGDVLLGMGFKPCRSDQDVWCRKDNNNTYEYLATHVDDILVASKEPWKIIEQIEEHFNLRNKTDQPEYYLGMNFKRTENGKIHISGTKYIQEMLRKYQEENGSLRKEKVPLRKDLHPEEDITELCDAPGIREFQKIIGICQWIITLGRIDIQMATSSLGRFLSAPRLGHLELAKKILGYLKKYPRKGFVINPAAGTFTTNDYDDVKCTQDFGNQYHYFKEEIDPQFPKPLVEEFDISIFVDADHAHDKTTGRSITGIIVFVGSTPVFSSSKRQSSVQTSTHGAEFVALKSAVEVAVDLRYRLRSLGVKVSESTKIYVDNMSVVLSTTNPGSKLNKKTVALAYHFVREHQANNVISIRKIHTKSNYADPFTKCLSNEEHHGFFNEFLIN